jgi:hypothetical protein
VQGPSAEKKKLPNIQVMLGCGSVIEDLSGMHKALGLILSTAKNKRNHHEIESWNFKNLFLLAKVYML